MNKIILLISMFGLAFSLPRYSLEEATNCMSCHVNPTGSGMRNIYGSSIYTLDELPLERLTYKGVEDWDGFTGFIHNVIYDEYLKDHPAPEDCEYYMCGPPMKNAAAIQMLEDLGVERENIYLDDFGG